jgi:putative peptide zinc metalloprotease protein
VLHELGHAFVAKMNGCRVPTMGVALLVLWPVLYTDVTDAWRLSSRRERLRIGAAGMGVELMLAAWATLAWSFLPDGPLRSACFLLATVTWVLTLAINLNPFLRFDGYYLLSDWLGVQNMQERGFALGRWRMREALFGLGLPKPEEVGPRLERRLVLYAYATWVWRFFLFVGIALIVYHFFFKLLGLFLMIVELAWFIGRPVWNEVKVWWGLRDRMKPTLNLAATLVVLGGLVALLVVPWQGHLRAPAAIEARQAVGIFPPGPARLSEVLAREGQTVAAGDPLYRLENPQLAQEMRLAELELAALQHEILRRSVSTRASGEIGVLEEQLAETLADLRGLRAQSARLEIAAPAAGILVDVPRHLVAGRWLAEDAPLGRVVDRSAPRLVAYVTAEQLARLSPGAEATIYPDDLGRAPIPAVVETIEDVDIEVLDRPWLSSQEGGPLAVQPDETGALLPVQPLYRVHLAPLDARAAPAQVLTGTARIEAEAESVAARLWRTAASVVIRESGF